MIKFIQHSSPKYPPRTYENASADATIAFAFDFNTPGERLTKDAVNTQGKMYVPIKPFIHNGEYVFSPDDVTIAIRCLNKCKASIVNIAGNQLCTTTKYSFTQDQCDAFVYKFLFSVLEESELQPRLHNNPTLIRSGGQSGFDEAGLKAAVKLGIPALCVCPQGWKFANEKGETICNEELFKSRFNSILIL